MQVTQITKPGELYIRLGNIIRSLKAGDKLPPYNQFIKELGVTQRSLDMVYERLQNEGVLEIRKNRGVFIKNPYAGGTFVFVAAGDTFLGYCRGENLRLYYKELQRAVNENFPGAKMEIYISQSPDILYTQREPQLRDKIRELNPQTRLLGAFVSYKITNPETVKCFDDNDIPFIDFNGDKFKIYDLMDNIESMVSLLRNNGYKKITMTGVYLDITRDTSPFYPEANKLLQNYLNANPDLNYCPLALKEGEDMSVIQNSIDWISNLIQQDSIPEALVVLDDYLCAGILSGAYMNNVCLEEHCKIITIANHKIPIHSKFPKKIIRMNYHWDDIAHKAVNTIGKFLTNSPCKLPVLIKPEIEKY